MSRVDDAVKYEGRPTGQDQEVICSWGGYACPDDEGNSWCWSQRGPVGWHRCQIDFIDGFSKWPFEGLMSGIWDAFG